MKKLIILGAGGYGRTVADMARQLGYNVAFLDDGQTGPSILGKCAEYRQFADADTEFYPGIGNNQARLAWIRRLREENIPVATLIHPTAYVSPKAAVGTGTAVLPMAMIGTDVTIREGCIINMGAIVDHGCVLENGVHLAPGAIVKAENRIPTGMKVESGEVIQNRQYPL